MAMLEARSTSMATRVLVIKSYPLNLLMVWSIYRLARWSRALQASGPNLGRGPVHHLLNLTQLKGLGDEIEDPLLEGLLGGFHGGEAGDDDHFGFRMHFFGFVQEAHAIDLFHLEIGNDDVIGGLLNLVHGLHALRESVHLI